MFDGLRSYPWTVLPTQAFIPSDRAHAAEGLFRGTVISKGGFFCQFMVRLLSYLLHLHSWELLITSWSLGLREVMNLRLGSDFTVSVK